MTTITTTTWTVCRADDASAASRGLTIEQAARELLGADGYTHEIVAEADGQGFRLLTSKASQNAAGPRGMNRSIFFSLNTDRAAAEAEIYEAVVTFDGEWHGPEAMTDAAYDAMIASDEDHGGETEMDDFDLGQEVDLAQDFDLAQDVVKSLRDAENNDHAAEAARLRAWLEEINARLIAGGYAAVEV